MSKLRLIVYSKNTGNRLYDCCFANIAIEPSLEQLHDSVLELKLIDIKNLGLLRYENGEYDQDFAECGANFIIDLEKLEPLFSYPDPNEPSIEQPYQAPLTEKVAQLELAQAATDTTLLELMESLLS